MSGKWEQVVENGQVIWINEDLGNVVQLDPQNFLALFPKICKFGPFKTSEEAKAFLESLDKSKLDEVINQELRK